jgi:hypothetical protein
MSLFPRRMYAMPEETERVARAIFPKGNVYMRWYDTFGMLFADEDFRALFAPDGQPALSPVRLSLVLILQFAEGLSDRQAAEAVRTRIDWTYLLCPELFEVRQHYHFAGWYPKLRSCPFPNLKTACPLPTEHIRIPVRFKIAPVFWRYEAR